MRKLMYATNLNGTEETGIVDVKSQRVFCLCTKEVADEILKSLGQENQPPTEQLKIIFNDCFVAGEEFIQGVNNAIARMEKKLPYDKKDLSVKNFNQWYEANKDKIEAIYREFKDK